MDGESAGNIEDETFSADKATITIHGVSAHPGFAKGKMENAIKIAARIVERLPKDTCRPRRPRAARASCIRRDLQARWKAHARFIVRDFTEDGLREKEALLEKIVKDVMTDFPRSTYEIWTSSSSTAT